jgi:hypothetical protein
LLTTGLGLNTWLDGPPVRGATFMDELLPPGAFDPPLRDGPPLEPLFPFGPAASLNTG